MAKYGCRRHKCSGLNEDKNLENGECVHRLPELERRHAR
jgi:hypothetical protein